MPWPRVEAFVNELLEIDSIRDIRLASKALIGLPQHWADEHLVSGIARLAGTAHLRGVQLSLHTHANAAQQITPSVCAAARRLLEAGLRDIRNQAVLLRSVNDSAQALLDLSFALLDQAAVMPYYIYMCDMIPFSEHWRTSVAQAQALQLDIMGYLPGFATPRIVCDVPFVGKRWVHQPCYYDRIRGISYWSKNYRTMAEVDDSEALTRLHEFYDPLDTLPPEGRRWWAGDHDDGRVSAPENTIRHSPMAATDR